MIVAPHGYIEKLLAMALRLDEDLVTASPPGMKPRPPMLANVDEAVLMAISHFGDAKKKKYLDDLETCLVINKTQREFVTSDDPVAETNRFHFQKLNDTTFGIGSAGAMFFMPLTPKLYFMAFDANVYAVSNRIGNAVAIYRDDEVAAFNELQILHARKNLYYADVQTGAIIAAEFKLHAARRPTTWQKISYFEKMSNSSSGEVFQRVGAMTLGPGKEFLTSMAAVRVRPSRWTKLLKYKLRPRYVDTGTGMGYVRPHHPMLRTDD